MPAEERRQGFLIPRRPACRLAAAGVRACGGWLPTWVRCLEGARLPGDARRGRGRGFLLLVSRSKAGFTEARPMPPV